VLSHHVVPGVLQQRQGIARRVTPAALLLLDVALRLVRALAMPMPQALEIAHRLIGAKGREFELPDATSIQIKADVETLSNDLNIRLERAVEMSPTPKRGRPRRK
jgi:hypothetical protein